MFVGLLGPSPPLFFAFLHSWIQITGEVWHTPGASCPIPMPLIKSVLSCDYQRVFEPIIIKETQGPRFSIRPPDSSCLWNYCSAFVCSECSLYPPPPLSSWHLFLAGWNSSLLLLSYWGCCIFCLAIWVCPLAWVQIALLNHSTNSFCTPCFLGC